MRTLEIIFWGMACFYVDEDAGTVDVILPDGRYNNPSGVETHYPMLWLRPTDKPPVKGRIWYEYMVNNFAIINPCDLVISGIKATPLDTTMLDDRLPSLTKADKSFALANRMSRQSIMEMTIDRGTLSAHEFPKGAIAVKWVVEVENTVTLDFGMTFLKLHPDTEQITIANAARSSMMMPQHFVLYRKLATVKKGTLNQKAPKVAPQKGGATIIDPPPDFSVASPFVDCSGAGYP
jgi:hypothetical protein